ncbi:MAG: NUDIX hydrolase [bacterium]|nr:NUDIX hydrolase [bacterium]
MEIIDLKVSVSGLLVRLERHTDTVCILIYNNEKKWILGQKPQYYLKGISRMVGGGVDVGEQHIDAAIRELQEETGLVVTVDELIPLIQINIEATAHTKIGSASLPIFLCITDQCLNASDDLESFAYLDDKEFTQLIDRFASLPAIMTPGDPLTWSDYGKIWGPAHAWAFEKAKQIIKEKGL